MAARAPTLRAALGAKARRGLTGVLLAFAVALLVRPVLFLTAALSDDDGTGDLWPALAATALQLVVLALAVSLFLRARREQPRTT